MSPTALDFFGRILTNLKRAKPGSILPVDPAHLFLGNVISPNWREECDTPEEWFIRTCRAFGLHATWDMLANRFRVRITKDAEDEATIAWPGKR